jgi:hypothetical protein
MAFCGNNSDISYASDMISFTTIPCMSVTDISVSNISAHMATVSWMGNESHEGYVIMYGPQGFPFGSDETQSIEVPHANYTITDLESETPYSLYVRAKCDSVNYSNWSQRVDFETNNNAIGTLDGVSVTIYPNPTSGSTTVALSGLNGKVALSVVDLNGRIVSFSEIQNSKFEIDLGGQTAGAYFVHIQSENVNMVKKLIVK